MTLSVSDTNSIAESISMYQVPFNGIQGNANVRYNPVLEDTRDEVTEINLYSVLCQGVYDWTTVIVSAGNSSAAQKNASDEYFRRTGALPQSVVVSLIGAN